MQDELLSLFPIPVLIAQYPISYEKELEYIHTLPYSDKKIENFSYHNQQSKDTFVLDKPELQNIRIFIESKVHKFVKEIMNFNNELVITQSWINKSTKGQCHQEHVHPNSIVSGVWYPVISDESPPIKFYNKNQRDISLEYERFNNFNSSTFLLPLKSGELIIFPSNLKHSVPVNQSETERISLSFNTWCKGSFGDINSLTYLPIQKCMEDKSML